MTVKGTKLSQFPIAPSPPAASDVFVGVQSPAGVPTDFLYTVAQAASAIGPLIPPSGRIGLTQATSYYVNSSTGNDSTGDGSSGNPWQTLSKANHFLQTHIDFGGQRVDLILQVPGTYPTSVDANNLVDWGGYVGGGILSIHGATNAPASYIVTDSTRAYSGNSVFAVVYSTPTQIRLDQLTMKVNQEFSGAVFLPALAEVWVAGNWADGLGQSFALDFSAPTATFGPTAFETGSGHLIVGGSCAVAVPTGGNIMNSWYIANARLGGNGVLEGACAYTFNGGFSVFSFGFCQVGVTAEGIMLGSGDTYTFTAGSCTGPRFTVANDGQINVFGAAAGLNYFPGSTPGTVGTGGQYII